MVFHLGVTGKPMTMSPEGYLQVLQAQKPQKLFQCFRTIIVLFHKKLQTTEYSTSEN